MKKIFIFLIFLFFIFCKRDGQIKNDYLLNDSMLKEDLFERSDFNKITFKLRNDTILVGEKGTGFIIEKQLFENYQGGDIVFEYKEFYTREEIIKNGLTTLSDKNEILQTSGMFYINFMENENKLIPKKGKFLKIQTQKEIKSNSQIFNINDDQNFKWSISKEDEIYIYIIDVVRNYQYGLSDGEGGFFKNVKLKEIEQERKNDLKKIEELKKISGRQMMIQNSSYEDNETNQVYELSNQVFEFYVSKFGWINIDEILKSAIDKEYDLKISKNKIDYLSVFVLYFDYNSNYNTIYTNLEEINKVSFLQIGKGKVVFVYKEDDKIFFDKFYFGNNNLETHSLNLKETSLQQLKQEMISM